MLFQFVSDYNGEDRFMTRIGVGGLINLDKLRQSHIVLNDIHLFHHHATLQRAMDARLQEEDRSRLVLFFFFFFFKHSICPWDFSNPRTRKWVCVKPCSVLPFLPLWHHDSSRRIQLIPAVTQLLTGSGSAGVLT